MVLFINRVLNNDNHSAMQNLQTNKKKGMKIGLVIFHFTHSHGSLLQNYALYRILKGMGHDVTVINDSINTITLTYCIKRTLYLLLQKIRGKYKGGVFFRKSTPKYLMKNLNPFIEKYFGHDVYRVFDEVDLSDYVSTSGFKALVVGSDQTWRPKFVRSIYYYYLDFAEQLSDIKRVAYVPSLGTDEWEYTNEQRERCGQLIKLFDSVSVREKSSVDVLYKQYGIKARWLLDPTFLLKKEDYESLIVELNRNKKQLSYSILDIDDKKRLFVKSIARRMSLKLVRINGREEEANAPLKERAAPSISQWLSGFRDAEFVIADSFHATVFAIIFNVPFLTIANKRRGLARFESLLSYFGLNDRLVTEIENVDYRILYNPIDWDTINKKIEQKRTEGINFLKDSLQ